MTAILAKNEADRFLRPVLERCKSFSDEVLVLDDRSTDSTVKLAQSLGCQVKTRSILNDPAWGHEAPARKELWDWGAEVAKDGWLLIADADMLLCGDPRQLTQSWDTNAWCFILYDCWSETQFRHGAYWRGHTVPRPWLFRPSAVPVDWGAQWPDRGIHCGHAPMNLPMAASVAPPDTYYWLHLAYSTPEARQQKHAQYLSKKALLSPGELAHAESILDA